MSDNVIKPNTNDGTPITNNTVSSTSSSTPHPNTSVPRFIRKKEGGYKFNANNKSNKPTIKLEKEKEKEKKGDETDSSVDYTNYEGEAEDVTTDLGHAKMIKEYSVQWYHYSEFFIVNNVEDAGSMYALINYFTTLKKVAKAAKSFDKALGAFKHGMNIVSPIWTQLGTSLFKLSQVHTNLSLKNGTGRRKGNIMISCNKSSFMKKRTWDLTPESMNARLIEGPGSYRFSCQDAIIDRKVISVEKMSNKIGETIRLTFEERAIVWTGENELTIDGREHIVLDKAIYDKLIDLVQCFVHT